MSPRKARLSQQDGEPGAELDGHGFVVGGAQAQGGTAVCGLAIGKLEDAEEDGAVAAEGKAFLLDADLVLLQDEFEHVHQFDMRNGFEGTGNFGHGDETQLVARNEIRVHMGQKLGVLHVFLLG